MARVVIEHLELHFEVDVDRRDPLVERVLEMILRHERASSEEERRQEDLAFDRSMEPLGLRGEGRRR